MKKIVCVLVALLTIVGICGCSSNPDEEIVSSEAEEQEEFVFPLGAWDGYTYTNEELAITLDFTDEWYASLLYVPSEDDLMNITFEEHAQLITDEEYIKYATDEYLERGFMKLLPAEKDFWNSLSVAVYGENSYQREECSDLTAFARASMKMFKDQYSDNDFTPTVSSINTIEVRGQEYLYYDTVLEYTYMYEEYGYAYMRYQRFMFSEVGDYYVAIIIDSDDVNTLEENSSILGVE